MSAVKGNRPYAARILCLYAYARVACVRARAHARARFLCVRRVSLCVCARVCVDRVAPRCILSAREISSRMDLSSRRYHGTTIRTDACIRLRSGGGHFESIVRRARHGSAAAIINIASRCNAKNGRFFVSSSSSSSFLPMTPRVIPRDPRRE